ncbi:MAG: D-2-hydroxyacid dehydrogenase [Firmicutes bacterium]|jgi:phosphoglycerate dehydrogenase-like enzyme|nr:D-2-hydroxyacid dehydrogenase [Bacillota bacterium]
MEGREIARVVATRQLTEEQVGIIEGATPGVAVVGARDRGQLLEEIVGAHVLFAAWGGVRLDAEILRAAANLRWIHVGSTGVETVLIPELVESDLVVTNSRRVHAVPVAEHVFAMLLALAKHLPEYDSQKARREWRRVPGDAVSGATLGIVGFGAVGREIAGRALAFGMRVLAVRRAAGDRDACGRDAAPAERVVGRERLAEVLGESDFVAICVPLTSETRGLIGRREMAAMKKGARLVNVSRGGVVDEAALVEALQSRHLAGAALDVFEREPLPPDSPLWSVDNLLMTPHVAGSRRDHIAALTEHFAENLRRWLSGEELLDIVDKRKGY